MKAAADVTSKARITNEWANVPASMTVGPKSYGVRVDGDCLLPHFAHGDTVICDPDQTPSAGDFVVIWWAGGARPPTGKRLVLAPPPAGFDANAALEPMLVCEQFNPPKQLSAPMSKVDRLHKVIGKAMSPAQEVSHG